MFARVAPSWTSMGDAASAALPSRQPSSSGRQAAAPSTSQAEAQQDRPGSGDVASK